VKGITQPISGTYLYSLYKICILSNKAAYIASVQGQMMGLSQYHWHLSVADPVCPHVVELILDTFEFF